MEAAASVARADLVVLHGGRRVRSVGDGVRNGVAVDAGFHPHRNGVVLRRYDANETRSASAPGVPDVARRITVVVVG